MNKLFLSLGLIIAVVITASADRRRLMMALNAAAATCSTSDTTLPHDELLEGFEGAGYENLWTETGTPDEDYDTSALTTGKPVGACNTGLRVNASGAEIYSVWARGSAIDTSATAADLVFYVYFLTLPDAGEFIDIGTVGNNTNPDTSQAARIVLSGTSGIRASGSTDSSFTAVSTGQWYEIKVHLDTTAANSYIQIDGGTQLTFTKSATLARYVTMGGNAVSGAENVDCVFDVVTLNTP